MKKANKIDALKKLKAEIKRDDYFSGLCYSITILYLFGKKITNGQKRYLRSLIPKKRPYSGYCWKHGVKSPRIKFINEQLKRLEKK